MFLRTAYPGQVGPGEDYAHCACARDPASGSRTGGHGCGGWGGAAPRCGSPAVLGVWDGRGSG